jgi:hypothetical protein
MSFDRNETRTTLETVVLGGVELRQVEVAYNYKPYSRTGDAEVSRHTYKHLEFDGEGLDGLNNARIILEALAQMDELTLADYNLEQLVEIVEEQASEIAEDLEIHFIYDRDGSKREYTPRSLWSPSGGCEWEESASEYDYGWDL